MRHCSPHQHWNRSSRCCRGIFWMKRCVFRVQNAAHHRSRCAVLRCATFLSSSMMRQIRRHSPHSPLIASQWTIFSRSRATSVTPRARTSSVAAHCCCRSPQNSWLKRCGDEPWSTCSETRRRLGAEKKMRSSSPRLSLVQSTGCRAHTTGSWTQIKPMSRKNSAHW